MIVVQRTLPNMYVSKQSTEVREIYRKRTADDYNIKYQQQGKLWASIAKSQNILPSKTVNCIIFNSLYDTFMRYRSRTDIIATMLESASNGPISKTRLMYMAYVPHEQMRSFVSMLVENDLLSFNYLTRQLHTTAKGLKFLQIYNRMQQCVDLMNQLEKPNEIDQGAIKSQVAVLNFFAWSILICSSRSN